jgi:hypothetical protein
VNTPNEYEEWISPLPKGVVVPVRPSSESIDFAHLFALTKKQFEIDFIKSKQMIKKNGRLWVSWPKKASKVATDLEENTIREFGLKNGLVDVKVCAVNEIWSGLKFVYRLKDRNNIK